MVGKGSLLRSHVLIVIGEVPCYDRCMALVTTIREGN